MLYYFFHILDWDSNYERTTKVIPLWNSNNDKGKKNHFLDPAQKPKWYGASHPNQTHKGAHLRSWGWSGHSISTQLKEIRPMKGFSRSRDTRSTKVVTTIHPARLALKSQGTLPRYADNSLVKDITCPIRTHDHCNIWAINNNYNRFLYRSCIILISYISLS